MDIEFYRASLHKMQFQCKSTDFYWQINWAAVKMRQNDIIYEQNKIDFIR